MRQRLLAQQLGLATPARDPKNKEPSTPTTPNSGGLPRSRSPAPWRTEPKVRSMPLTPDSSSSWRTKMVSDSSTPTRRTPFLGTPQTKRLGREIGSPSGSKSPLEHSNISTKEREKQLKTMLQSVVTVVDKVDMASAEIPGLRCRLLPHQVQGVEWMQKRERGEIKGGILADDMGLGKTVQMLALILKNNSLTSIQGMNKADDLSARLAKEGLDSLQQRKPHKKAYADDTDGDVFVDEKDNFVSQRRRDVLHSGSKTTLIVAPLAVVEQWEREATEKTGRRLQVYVHHGPGRAKAADTLRSADLVITTFATAASEHTQYLAETQHSGDEKQIRGAYSRDIVDVSSESESESDTRMHRSVKHVLKTSKLSKAPLFQVKWLRVVLDEAQNIKNYRAKSTQACYELSLNAATRWCLTGTPLQNNVLELFSLIHFLRAAPFDDLSHFREKIDEPIKSHIQARAEIGLRRLCVILRTIMLRRTKDAKYNGQPLLQLPERKVEVIALEFEDNLELEFYRSIEARMNSHLEDSQTGKSDMMGMLVMLLRLRQGLITGRGPVTNHDTSTSVQSATSGTNANPEDELADLLSGLSVQSQLCERCQVSLPASHQPKGTAMLCAGCEQQAIEEARNGIQWHTRSSSKMNKILSLLQDFRTNAKQDKTIVFSQFTSFLDLVELALKKKGFTYVRYDGKMTRTARENALSAIRHQEDVQVILISFKAGSTGLNLTCCNRVILCDLWWNPQIEEQAFDRAHRLGQTENVFIYKLSIAGTVEERILRLQDKKRALANAALQGSTQANQSFGLSSEEIRFLFRGNEIS
ncbi:hypothetical protein MYAM1_001495 [Malassezia yamatoensis]|uniref:Uncharacterized protein n=1 Tax=Malassezia yamatoensis TaxID=253288 RepID=A0AAJ5YQH8_9BASI|nr:hypothetical protein MYAM1_001495 [Malassezia yamatoensis]